MQRLSFIAVSVLLALSPLSSSAIPLPPLSSSTSNHDSQQQPTRLQLARQYMQSHFPVDLTSTDASSITPSSHQLIPIRDFLHKEYGFTHWDYLKILQEQKLQQKNSMNNVDHSTSTKHSDHPEITPAPFSEEEEEVEEEDGDKVGELNSLQMLPLPPLLARGHSTENHEQKGEDKDTEMDSSLPVSTGTEPRFLGRTWDRLASFFPDSSMIFDPRQHEYDHGVRAIEEDELLEEDDEEVQSPLARNEDEIPTISFSSTDDDSAAQIPSLASAATSASATAAAYYNTNSGNIATPDWIPRFAIPSHLLSQQDIAHVAELATSSSGALSSSGSTPSLASNGNTMMVPNNGNTNGNARRRGGFFDPLLSRMRNIAAYLPNSNSNNNANNNNNANSNYRRRNQRPSLDGDGSHNGRHDHINIQQYDEGDMVILLNP